MTYFKPLRRKIGVLTLATACVLMGGWTRSLAYYNSLIIRGYGVTVFFLDSNSGCLSFTRQREWPLSGMTLRPRLPTWFEHNTGAIEGRGLTFSSNAVLIFNYLGMRRTCKGRSLQSHWQQEIIAVHYWSIVIPLTLLSAYLLLSKPRANVSAPTHV